MTNVGRGEMKKSLRTPKKVSFGFVTCIVFCLVSDFLPLYLWFLSLKINFIFFFNLKVNLTILIFKHFTHQKYYEK